MYFTYPFLVFCSTYSHPRHLLSFPTRRSSDLTLLFVAKVQLTTFGAGQTLRSLLVIVVVVGVKVLERIVNPLLFEVAKHNVVTTNVTLTIMPSITPD